MKRLPLHAVFPLALCIVGDSKGRHTQIGSQRFDKLAAPGMITHEPEARKEPVHQSIFFNRGESEKARPRNLKKIAQNVMGNEIFLPSPVRKIEGVCVQSLRKIAHHSEVIVRDGVADWISQQDAATDRAMRK